MAHYLANPAVQWELRLEAIKERYSCYKFYSVFGVAPFIDKLIAAAKQMQYSETILPNPTFAFGTFYYPGTIASQLESTVVHESVHAVDFLNHWYMGSTQALTWPTMQQVEALGWTTQHLVDTFSHFANVENALCGNSPDAGGIIQRWNLAQTNLADVFTQTIEWKSSPVTSANRTVLPSDVADVAAKLNLDFRMVTLAAAYEQMATSRGLTHSIVVNPSIVDPVFRR
ncbi:MAG: hypothetical protein WBH28_14745 [Fuerstiella sp.]